MDPTSYSRAMPTGASPNSLQFVVENETVELNRMKDDRLPTGGYVSLTVSSKKGAQSAEGKFTGYQKGDVDAHKDVHLTLYMSFGYGLNLESATEPKDFSEHFHYFYTIVSDPTHTRDHTGGCMIVRDDPERVKSGNRTYWMPGKERGPDKSREMSPDNLLVHFEGWEDGVLSGWCFDPADPEGSNMGGGTCDVKVFFRVRLEESSSG
uniref:Uncharacterized protein n=1 Tax=Pseudictyota dubia TaxID=2749911 RepID=A0A7R9W5S2_9STRA|mmetsp:Transcript_32987/g.60790  ORF Transcript_32987/g.60790 Transcript_32987/m.60790 type:complete len:208 (+) Transcript_32987:94-717(+)